MTGFDNDPDTLNAFESLPGIYVIVKPDAPRFSVFAVSKGVIDLMHPGKKSADLRGLPFFECFSQDTQDPERSGSYSLRESFENILVSKQTDEHPKLRYDVPDGAGNTIESYWSVTNIPVFNEAGGIAGILHTSKDITDKLHAVNLDLELKALDKAYQLFMAAPVAISIVSGPEYRIDMINENMLTLLGRNAAVVGKPIRDTLTEADKQGLITMLDTVYKTGKPVHLESYPAEIIIEGERHSFYFDMVFKPYSYIEKDRSSIFCLAFNVTQQVIEREKAREKDAHIQRFKFMADHAADPFILMREDGSFAYLNDKALEAWGYSSEEATNIRVTDVDPCHTIETYQELFHTAQLGAVPEMETIHRRKDGSTFPVQVSINGLKIGDEQYLFAIARNITKLKRDAQLLQQTEARTRLAIEAAHLGTYDLNLATRTISYSPRLAEIFGLPTEGVLPHIDFVNALHPDDQSIRTEAHKKFLETGELFYESRLIHPDGSVVWARFNGKSMPNENEDPSIVGTAMDITSEKKAAELLEKKIEERTAELQFVNEKLRQFTYAASHDLQEPLRKISFFLDRLFTKLGNDLSEDNQSIIERIQHTTGRMRTLIDNLLDYSNTSLGAFAFQPVNLADIVRGVVDDMEASIIETNAEIIVHATGDVQGDERQLRQLFQNLLSNSLKYRRKDVIPTVHIDASVQTGIKAPAHVQIPAGKAFHVITVSDNGIGFEPEYADSIFKLFQRLHGKNTYEGTGVGLALVQKVVENHNGFIWADGRPREGSIFTVLLPVVI